MRRCLFAEFGVVGIAVVILLVSLSFPALLLMLGSDDPYYAYFDEGLSVQPVGEFDTTFRTLSIANPIGVVIEMGMYSGIAGAPSIDAYTVLYGYTPSRAVVTIGASLTIAAFFVMLVCVFPLKRGRGIGRVGLGPLWRDSYLLYTFGLFIAFVGIGSLHRLIPGPEFREMFGWMTDEISLVGGDGAPTWLVLLAVVVASVTTETIARGYLYGRLRLAGVSVRWAIAASAFVYAVLTLPLGFGAMVALAIYSIPACLVFQRVGSLTPLILAAILGHTALLMIGVAA